MESILIIKFKHEVNIATNFLFGNNPYVIFGLNEELKKIIVDYKNEIVEKTIINISNNKLFNLYDYTKTKCRIEPGAIIREDVNLADDCIILMGAVINTKACIGSKTMIDMNAVIGSGVIIGSGCHIGAGAVLAGVLEPVSKQCVTINDDVFIGANAVILEGVTVGRGAVIGAGAIVTKDIKENEVVYNKQNIILSDITKEIKNKIKLNDDLR